jgi:C-terminal processing protease CtpA/Prc
MIGRGRAFFLAIAFPAAAAAQATPRLDRLAVVSGIWVEARYNFAGWEHVTADWDSAYRATIEAAERGGTDVAFYRALKRFAALLGSGDVAIRPPPAVSRRIGRTPIRLQSIDGRALVMQVQPTAETRIAGVVPGDEIVQVRGIPVERWLRDSVLPETPGSSDAARLSLAVEELLTGQRGTAVQITLRTVDGTPRGASLTRSVAWETRIVPSELRDGFAVRDTAGVRVVTLGDVDDDRIVREFSEALIKEPLPTGLVLDLRGALGGGHQLALRLAAHVLTAPGEPPRAMHRIYWPMRTGSDTADVWTWHLTLPDTVTPAADAFGGPLVVVTSSRTAGAGELLTAIVRMTGRAPVLGTVTSGSPGMTTSLALPGGWELVLPVAIPVAADASEIALGGIEPDHRVRPSVADVHTGHDRALARALEILDQAAQNGNSDTLPSR